MGEIDRPLAVIDVGSNSIRCLIVKLENKVSKVLEKKLVTTRLGKGLSKRNLIDPSAMESSLETLEYYMSLVEAHGAKLYRVIGTSALREAKNAKEFVRRAEKELNIKIEVISGEEEADLTSKGALYDKNLQESLVFDLGGGSLELISQEPYFVKSFDIGAVKILEKLGLDPFEEQKQNFWVDFNKLYELVEMELKEGLKDLLDTREKKYLIGVGGTATSLAMLKQGLETYDEDKIQDYYISKFEVYRLIDKLNELSLSERRKIKGMQRDREDIIVSGGGIIWSLMEYLSFEGYFVSDRDLLYGMIYNELTYK